MHARRFVFLLAPVLLAGLALTLLFSLLPGSNPVRAALPATDPPTAPASPSPLEPRWLELVRSLPAAEITLAPQTDFTLNANLTAGSLAGAVPTLQEVTARVLRAGELVSQGSAFPFPDPSGNFYAISLNWGGEPYPCPPDTCYAYGFEPGDQVWVEQGSAAISMTVPVLTALAEPMDDSLFGQAPASAPLTAYLLPFADPSAVFTASASAGADGAYLFDLGPVYNLHRQDSGYVLLENAPGRRAYRYFVAPLLRAQVGGGVFSGLIAPDTEVQVAHTNSTGQVLSIYHSTSNERGEFEFIGWYEPDLLRLQLNPSDVLIVEAGGQVFSMTLPTLTAQSDLASQQVSGGAAPGSILEARRYIGPLYTSSRQDIWNETPVQVTPVTASPGGTYTASLALSPGDYVGVFMTLPDEHQAYARSATPAIFARMNNLGISDGSFYTTIQGQIDQVFTPVTVTIQGPSGYFKDWRVLEVGSNGAFYFYSSYPSDQLALDEGDILRVSSPAGEQIAFTLPRLSAEAGANSATISGAAPPGSRLLVQVYNAYPLPSDLTAHLAGVDGSGAPGEPPFTQVVTASASGEYLADFSAALQFYSSYTYGEVILEDPPGYTTSRTWKAGGCPPRLLEAQVGGNRLIVSGDTTCAEAFVRLRNSQGEIKAESPLYYFSGGERGGYQVDLFDPQGIPVRIVADDRVEISYLGEVTTSLVPRMSVQVDKATSLVSGEASAGQPVRIELKRADDYTRSELALVTATQSGAFQADLSASYSYATGDRLFASLASSGVSFYTLAIPPVMRVQLYDNFLAGWLPPLTPFSLLHTFGVTSTRQISGVAETEGSLYASFFNGNWQPILLAPGDQLDMKTPEGTYSLLLPELTTHLDRQAARLSGLAPPNARLLVTLSDADEDGSYAQITQLITASALGEYSLDFPYLLPLGDTQGRLAHLHPAGHQVTLMFATPRWHVQLGSQCAGGILPVGGAPAQATLTKPSGFKETVDVLPVYYNVSEFNACFSYGVQSGDLLELRDNQGNQLSYRVPVLEVRHDYARQALIGNATPGARVKVEFNTFYGSVTRTPWLEPDGSFGIDTSDLDLMPSVQNYGTVIRTDAQGNQVTRFFQITGVQVFLPVISR